MEKIEVRFRLQTTGEIKTFIVEDYGIIQAIEQVRFDNDYYGLVLSAQYVDEENVIKKLS
jgi:hypothetical protein